MKNANRPGGSQATTQPFDTLPPPEAIQGVREDLTIARVEMSRGAYAEAARAIAAASEKLPGLARKYPRAAIVRDLGAEVKAATTRLQNACGAERDIALKRGGTPPVCQ